jgi:hypothetical protein
MSTDLSVSQRAKSSGARPLSGRQGLAYYLSWVKPAGCTFSVSHCGRMEENVWRCGTVLEGLRELGV